MADRGAALRLAVPSYASDLLARQTRDPDEWKQGIGNLRYGQKVYFLQVSTSTGPVLPFPEEEEEVAGEEAAPTPRLRRSGSPCC